MSELKIISEKIKSDNELLKSLTVTYHEATDSCEEYICFDCKRYMGNESNYISGPQYGYIKQICDYRSNRNLLRLNKWAASAIISAVKNYNLDKKNTYVVSSKY